MGMPDLSSLGSLGVPAFAAIFLLGWGACRLYLVKPLEMRVKALEDRDAAYRKQVDEELQMYRQKVRG